MTLAEKYDNTKTGLLWGTLLPLLIALFIFLFAKGDPTLSEWLNKVKEADIATHIITLSVFPNVFIFLVFNHFDMLRASRGILAVTIIWAVIVFLVKFLL
jgi:hypothetical protein